MHEPRNENKICRGRISSLVSSTSPARRTLLGRRPAGLTYIAHQNIGGVRRCLGDGAGCSTWKVLVCRTPKQEYNMPAARRAVHMRAYAD